jgi:hypothetical protein
LFTGELAAARLPRRNRVEGALFMLRGGLIMCHNLMDEKQQEALKRD